MDKIWLSSYPPGVPHEIDPRAYASLAELYAEASARYRDLPAFSSLGATRTHGSRSTPAKQGKGRDRALRCA